MAREREPAWSLNPAEVQSSWRSGNISGRARAAHSRALDTTDATVTLEHAPTNIEVSGGVQPGHYTRTQMRQLKEELHRRLFAELERLVANHLRVPGR